MGWFGGSDDSTVSTDNSIDDRSVNLSGDAQQGTFAEDSELSNISGGYRSHVEINLLDADAVSDAFNFAEDALDLAEESNEAVYRVAGVAFDTFDDVNRDSLDAFGDISRDANSLVESSLNIVSDIANEAFSLTEITTRNSFDTYADISESSDNLVKSSLGILSDVVNRAFSFSSDAQSDAIEAIEKTTSDQTEAFSQSLEAVQKSASTAVTQGSNEIIKLVMMGLVGFGLVIAIFSGNK